MELLSTLLGIFIINVQLYTAFAAEQKFTLVKGSVTLTVPGREDKEGLKKFIWTYGGLDIVDYGKKSDFVDYDTAFEGRVEFDKNTFSLRLDNLQMKDSGLYTATRHPDGKPSETVIEYQLSVLEPVVVPTLTVVSKWSSSDSCNVTLKCTGLNVSLISSCNATFCSQEGGSRFLSISLSNNTVSCNHSNPVSWRQTTVDLSSLCQLPPPDDPSPDVPWWVFVIIAAVVITAVLAVTYFVMTKRQGGGEVNKGQSNDDGRSQETAGEVESPGCTDNPYAEAVTTTQSTSPATVYDTVQLNRLPNSSEAPLIPSHPETIYSEVNKKKKDCPNKS